MTRKVFYLYKYMLGGKPKYQKVYQFSDGLYVDGVGFGTCTKIKENDKNLVKAYRKDGKVYLVKEDLK